MSMKPNRFPENGSRGTLIVDIDRDQTEFIQVSKSKSFARIAGRVVGHDHGDELIAPVYFPPFADQDGFEFGEQIYGASRIAIIAIRDDEICADGHKRLAFRFDGDEVVVLETVEQARQGLNQACPSSSLITSDTSYLSVSERYDLNKELYVSQRFGFKGHNIHTLQNSLSGCIETLEKIRRKLVAKLEGLVLPEPYIRPGNYSGLDNISRDRYDDYQPFIDKAINSNWLGGIVAKEVQFLDLHLKKTLTKCNAYHKAILVEHELRSQPVPDIVLEAEADDSPSADF